VDQAIRCAAGEERHGSDVCDALIECYVTAIFLERRALGGSICIILFTLLVVVLFPGLGAAQSSLAGEWAMTVHDPFNPVVRLRLDVKGDSVTGSLPGRPSEGMVTGGR
jgi:hypothetical protein